MELFKLNINDINYEDINFIKDNYPKRYNKAKEYKNDSDFLRSIGAGLLIEKAYPRYDEDDLLLSEYGKPYFLNDNSFNVSHSGDMVVLVKGEKDETIGVDIIKKDQKNLKIMYKVCSKEEVDYINQDKINNFHIIWSLKEATLKCVGIGITLFLNKLNVMRLIKGESIALYDMEVFGKVINEDDYIISVVSTKKFE